MATPLPPATDFTGASVTEGGFKTAVTSLRAYLAEILGTNGGGRADATSGSVFRKNLIIGGGCNVAQDSVKTLSTSPQFAQVDMFACWASAGAVSAGTLTQDVASPIGITGFALKLAGVTLTGAGQLSVRHRIESFDAKRMKNQTASFAAQVFHDIGSTFNYTIVIRKANSLDNFGATTVIGTSSAQAVATSTGTQVTFPALSMGDCSNGIEIEIQAACGAVTTKNFSFTEMQIEAAPSPTVFEYEDIERALQRMLRHFQKSFPYATAPAQNAGRVGATEWILQTAGAATSQMANTLPFIVPMRNTPNMVFYNPSATNAFARNATRSTDATSTTGGVASSANTLSINIVGLAAWTVGDTISAHWSADARL